MEARKDKYTGKERRKYPRIPAALVEYSPTGEIISKKSFTENISPIGICILVSEQIAINTLLSLKIYLPDSKNPIETKGRVVWIRKSPFLNVKGRKHYDLGIEFEEIDEDDLQRVRQYKPKYPNENQPF